MMVTRPLHMMILKTFQRTEMDDLTLQGAPILPGRAMDKAMQEKTDKFEVMSRLHLLQPHDDLTLLRNSISVQKLLYTLRTSSAATITNFWSLTSCSENASHTSSTSTCMTTNGYKLLFQYKMEVSVFAV